MIQRENTSSYIEEAISAGYDVEIDVWLLDKKWYLGHDYPHEEIDLSFMERPCIWAHCKNLIGYVSLYNNRNTHVFWHNKDDYTFTSKGIKWCKSGIITHDGIMVMPEDSEYALNAIRTYVEPLGICTDNFDLFV